jgi:hypothetical protein
MSAVTTATAINREHQLAQQSAESAVQHATRCGQLLADAKATLPHGQFQKWIEANCLFEYSTAARYMKAARQKSTGVEISSLRHLFPSGRPDPTPWATWTPPDWFPASGEHVIAEHKYRPAVTVFVQPAEAHPGFYHAALYEGVFTDGAVVEGAKRPAHGWLIDKHLLPRWGGAESFDWQRYPGTSDVWEMLTGGQP